MNVAILRNLNYLRNQKFPKPSDAPRTESRKIALKRHAPCLRATSLAHFLSLGRLAPTREAQSTSTSESCTPQYEIRWTPCESTIKAKASSPLVPKP